METLGTPRKHTAGGSSASPGGHLRKLKVLSPIKNGECEVVFDKVAFLSLPHRK